MFLSRLSLICVILYIIIGTCHSHRRRTMRIKRPDDYDYDYGVNDAMIMRKPMARGSYRSDLTRIVRDVTCGGNSFFHTFRVLTAFTHPLSEYLQKCAYGVFLKCEIGTDILLNGLEQQHSDISAAYSTGRVSSIKYWKVDDRIYKIAMAGTTRTNVWESNKWEPGTVVEAEVHCSANEYGYLLRGYFIPAESGEPDYLSDLSIRCRAIFPG